MVCFLQAEDCGHLGSGDSRFRVDIATQFKACSRPCILFLVLLAVAPALAFDLVFLQVSLPSE